MGIRKYIDPKTGRQYDSVTSVTGVIAKPMLYGWYGKHGYKGCQAIMKESARRGSIIHDLLDQEAKGQAIDLSSQPEFVKRPVELYREWAKEVDLRSIASEMQLFHPQWEVAGTFDRLAYVNDRLAIVDWKTGSAIYDEYNIQMS